MRVFSINGTYRKKGTTTRLTEAALEGATSLGASTEMVLLTEKEIRYCTNCLTCYRDIESTIAPCAIEDDVHEILIKIADADAVLFTSPVHCGFVTALMTTFIHRASWRLLRPTGEILGLKGCPEPRLTDKARAVATIVSAGGMPTELRKYCDTGSPWLQDMAACICNGECVADMYAGAVFSKALEGDEWSRMYLFRELTDEQLGQAYDLGVTLARAVKEKRIRPYDPMRMIEPIEQQDVT
ncbi:MAG: flavodoxin family protein [Desulforhabdus sp.]|jgi:multimeric flavodoxin WrbA|nr:flavodoxin family protein [Desulforhabdus sp.]